MRISSFKIFVLLIFGTDSLVTSSSRDTIISCPGQEIRGTKTDDNVKLIQETKRNQRKHLCSSILYTDLNVLLCYVGKVH